MQNPNHPSAQVLIRDAESGRKHIARLAGTNLIAGRCTRCLQSLFEDLYENIDVDHNGKETVVKRLRRSDSWQRGSQPTTFDSPSDGLSADNLTQQMDAHMIEDIAQQDLLGNLVDMSSFLYPEGSCFQLPSSYGSYPNIAPAFPANIETLATMDVSFGPQLSGHLPAFSATNTFPIDAHQSMIIDPSYPHQWLLGPAPE